MATDKDVNAAQELLRFNDQIDVLLRQQFTELGLTSEAIRYRGNGLWWVGEQLFTVTRMEPRFQIWAQNPITGESEMVAERDTQIAAVHALLQAMLMYCFPEANAPEAHGTEVAAAVVGDEGKDSHEDTGLPVSPEREARSDALRPADVWRGFVLVLLIFPAWCLFLGIGMVVHHHPLMLIPLTIVLGAFAWRTAFYGRC